MKLQAFNIYMLFLLGSSLASAQCYTDRHNTTAAAGWTSCQASLSPNALRGESHWISYDLGEPTGLGQMQLWNINNPAELSSGASLIAIDYSDDGVNWTAFGEMELDAAQGSGFYEGVQALDFERLTTRYLLFTILENHGGECYGFAELKIETLDPVSTSELADESFLKLFPSPATTFTQVSFSSVKTGPAILSVVDMAGKQLKADKVTIQAGENLVQLDVSDLVSGQYLVRIKSDNHNHTAELTIINN